VVDFLLVLIELFCQLSRLRHYEQILVEIVLVKRGVGHFERKFEGERGVVHQRILVSENYSLWAIMWCYLRDPTFSRFDTIPACDTHTHTHTHRQRQAHDDGYYPRRTSSVRVQIWGIDRICSRQKLIRYWKFRVRD